MKNGLPLLKNALLFSGGAVGFVLIIFIILACTGQLSAYENFLIAASSAVLGMLGANAGQVIEIYKTRYSRPEQSE